jgi:hypothetical protein
MPRHHLACGYKIPFAIAEKALAAFLRQTDKYSAPYNCEQTKQR